MKCGSDGNLLQPTHQTLMNTACPYSSTSFRQFRELSMTILDENWPPTTPEREATRPRMAKPSNLILITAAMVVLSCVLCGAVDAFAIPILRSSMMTKWRGGKKGGTLPLVLAGTFTQVEFARSSCLAGNILFDHVPCMTIDHGIRTPAARCPPAAYCLALLLCGCC